MNWSISTNIFTSRFDRDPAEAVPHSRAQLWRRGGLLVALTILAYLPAFRAGFIWQDDQNITQNSLLRSTAGLWRIWTDPSALPRFQPLTYTSFWVQHHLWGDDPAGYHAVSVLLHVANVLLLWTLLRRLSVPGAWLAAALFALHPIQVEAVAWVSQQGTVLSGFFFLSALLGYLRWAEVTPAEPEWEERGLRLGLPEHPVALYVMTMVLLSLACASHITAAGWPLIVVALLAWKKGKLRRQDVLPLVPALIISLLVAARFLYAAGWAPEDPAASDRNAVFGAVVGDAGRLMAWHATDLLMPHAITLDRPGWNSPPPHAVWPLAGLVIASFLVVVFWCRRRRFGVGPLTVFACFFALLLPVLLHLESSPAAGSVGYLAVGTAVAGIAAIAGLSFWRHARQKWRANGGSRAWAGAGVAAALMGGASFGMLTSSAASAFANDERLWARALAQNAHSLMGQNGMGHVRMMQGRLDAAADHFREALAQDPGNPTTVLNLATCLERRGDTDQAIGHFVALSRRQPERAQWLGRAAESLVKAGRFAEAEAQARAALATQPADEGAGVTLGIALLMQGKSSEALQKFESALRQNPRSIPAHVNAAAALYAEGNLPAAAEHLATVAGLDPANYGAHRNAGVLLYQSGLFDQAEAVFRSAIFLRPRSAEAYNDLGLVLAAKQRSGEAAFCFHRAVVLAPAFNAARQNLAAQKIASQPTISRSHAEGDATSPGTIDNLTGNLPNPVR